MSDLDLELRETALDAVKGLCDTPMTLIRKSDPTYDPTTGDAVAGVDSSFEVWGLKDSFSLRTIGTGLEPGTLIQAGDILVTIPAGQGIDPKAGDRLIAEGEIWNVVGIRAQYGTDLAIQWEMAVRRG